MNNKYVKYFFNVLLWTSIVVYILLMASLLLFKYISPLDLFKTDRHVFRDVNFIPLVGIFKYLFGGIVSKTVALFNVFGNILIFIPMGVLLQLMCSNQSIRKTVAIVCITSVVVELLQFTFGLGSLDIDDVILNTLGGFIGALMFFICNKWIKDRGKIRVIITILAFLCAMVMVLRYGKVWYRITFPDQYRAETRKKYGMDLEQADITGVYKSTAGNILTITLGQGNQTGELTDIIISDETVISLIRRDQYGEINVFEKIDIEFLRTMTANLPIWVDLSDNEGSYEAKTICIGDNPVEFKD